MQYQFWLYNPNVTPAWSPLQAYSVQAACTWTPAAAGQYLISITAKDGVTGTEVNTLLSYLIDIPLTAVSVTASPASPQPPNTPITVTASATGGANVQYQFWLFNPNVSPTWSPLQAYSALAACTWTPAAAGQYLISITAKDGVTGTEVNTLLSYLIDIPLTAVSATAFPASPQPPNTPITVTASATGGANVQFQFWLYNPNVSPDGVHCKPTRRRLPARGRRRQRDIT